MKDLGSIVLFMLLVLGSGIIIGTMTMPGDWYSNLNKSFFNPPAWIFAPVWTLLYLAIAIAGWLVWLRRGETILRRLWIIQMGLNFLRSTVFFCRSATRSGDCHHHDASEFDLGLHYSRMAHQPRRRPAICPLCRLGGICDGFERRNLLPQPGGLR